MYSASQLERATTFCLMECQLTKQLPRKKSDPLVLLLVSTSLGEVTVGVADEASASWSLGVVEAKVKRAGEVAQDSLDRPLMLDSWPLHEPTHKAGGLGQVRACVHQVAQAPDETPVLSGVD